MATKPVPFLERVSLEIKEAIKKASSSKLKQRLVKIGVLEEEVENMSREQLMEAWAEAVFLEKDKAEVVKEEVALQTMPTPVPKWGYDPDVERERMAWKKRNGRWSERIG